jgi:cytoskeletal protein CcmA (bactofilin family)
MKKMLYGLAVLALLFMPTRSVYAAGGVMDGRVIIGQSFTLKSGETLDGDLVVIGGGVSIDSGASVKGDVVVIGGSLKLEGEVSGSAVVIGGAASIGEGASLAGDIVTLGGSLQRAEGARIGGDIINNLPPPDLSLPNATAIPTPPVPPQPQIQFDFGPLGRIVALFLQALGLTALAMLLAAFLHPQLDRVAHAVLTQPFVAGSIGLLTAFLAPIAVVILTVTLILIPVALTAAILLVLAWLFGVVALGLVIGDRLNEALHKTWEPVISAGLGTFVLALGVGTMNLVPCVGWLAGALVGLLGLGATVITIFGTRSLTQTAPPSIVSNIATPPGAAPPPTT